MSKCGRVHSTFGMLSAVMALALSETRTLADEPGRLPVCAAGWKIEIVAQSPQVKHPSVVCCAADGRVFVAEDPMDISTPTADVPEGRILCLYPDGSIKVFADKLFAVFGMQYIDGYLYVLHNPKFSRFRDEDGVGADRFDLIEQTHPKPWDLNWNDHVPANFRLAMDGFLYVDVGDKGLFGAVGRDGLRVDLRGGGILRLRPDGTELEVYCTGVRNILDVAMDATGEIFTYDNTDEHGWMGRLTHMVDGGFYGYPYDFQPRRPYTLWMMADFGGGAATGSLCYTEDTLPDEYRGNLFLGDFGKRQILRVQLAPDGATFQATSQTDMFLDPPGDFRPVGICLAPDGASLYVCDWNHTDTKDVVACGRLLRLTYTGTLAAAPKPKWFVQAATGGSCPATVAELLEALSHPAMSVRLVAQRRLAERGHQSHPDLVALLRDNSATAVARTHALWALDAIDHGRATVKLTQELAMRGDNLVRRQAIRQLGTRRVASAVTVLADGLRDDDACIRFQAATALGRIADDAAVGPLLDALAEADTFTRYAVFTALNRLGQSRPEAWPRIVAALADDRTAVRQGAALALRATWNVDLARTLAGFSADAKHDPLSRAEAVTILSAMLRRPPPWNGQWWAYHPALKLPPVEQEDWAGTGVVLDTLKERIGDEAPAVRLAAVIGLRRAASDELKPVLRQTFVDEVDTQVRTELLGAFGELKDNDAEPLIEGALSDPAAPQGLRVAAINAAAKVGTPGLADALQRFLQSNPIGELTATAAAAEALGTLRAAGAVELLASVARHDDVAARRSATGALSRIGGERAVAHLIELSQVPDPEARLDAIVALGEVRSLPATLALLEAYERADSRLAAQAALARQPDAAALDVYLDGLGGDNSDLRHQCREALRSIRESIRSALESRVAALPEVVVARLQDIYRDDEQVRAGPIFARHVQDYDPASLVTYARDHRGDPQRGRTRFHDATGLGCAKCHAVNTVGGAVGPDLSHIGEKFDRVQLAEHVVYPHKLIREGYLQVTVALEDGRVLAGIIAGETADNVVLRDAQSREHVLAVSEIEDRQLSNQSLMPERIVEGIPPEAFADLISYLESLRRRGGAGR